MKKVVVAMGCWLVLLTGLWGNAVAGDYKLPDTGQTKCYDNVGEISCPQPGEPFYGQDGCYTINPPSYTKLDAQGNDLPDLATEWVMVRDNVTGLIWEVKTDDGSIHYMHNRYTWQNAQDMFIADLNSHQFGGYTDWRMPTIKELTTIIDHGKHDPAINTDYFPNTMSPQYWRPAYWSSTTFANKSDDAWGVSFYSAIVGVYLKYDYSDDGNFVRAVRGDSRAVQNSFVDNGDGTVTDTAIGLMWQKETADFKMNWEEALSYCENLTLARYNDWRLPNERELGSLVDYDKYEPSIDTIVFPDTVSFYYWSSTTYSLDRRQACDICFEWGLSNQFDKFHQYSDGYYVRAVRGGQASSFNNLTFPLSGTLADRTVNLSFGADWPDGECDGLIKKHAGVDISAVKGESVYVAKLGIVRAIVDGGTQWEKAVTIEHTSSNPVFTTVYWHIDPTVTVGQTVISGQIIGNIADLGDNTHFHFGVRMSAYSNISNRGALPQTDCGGDPAFPEYFIDPETISYEELTIYWPVDSPVITQDYACYNCYKNNEKFHTGIDAYSSNYDPWDYDTPVKATSAGEIVCLYRTSDSETTWCDGSMDYFDEIPTRNRGFGNTVIIKHSDKYSLYGHLDCINREMVERFLKIEGKSPHVSNGEDLGIMGNSSDQKRRSPKIGPHLHFEIKDRGVLGDPKYDKDFGYTKSLPPDRCGYNDPMLFLHPETEDITPIPVRATNNVNILPGPGFYELKLNTLYLDQKIVTFRKAFNENGIWYQVYLAVPRRNPDIDRFSNVVEGWISGNFIEEDSVTKVRVKEGIKEPVVVYRKPGKGKIALVWSQQEFVVSTTMDGKGCQSMWYKVFLGNIRLEKEEIQQGWICGDFVDEVQ